MWLISFLRYSEIRMAAFPFASIDCEQPPHRAGVLTSPGIMGVIGAMNERCAERLGFDPSTIEKAHCAEITKLNSVRISSN
jgi:hypothetical protein